MTTRILIVLLGLFLSLYLFKKAASTLNIGKINIISYIMYLFFLQTYIGASLVYLGDKNHYTMKYIINPQSYDVMFYCVLATAILFPLTIIGIYKLLRIDIQKEYSNYLTAEMNTKSEKVMFYLVAGVGAISCVLLLVYIIKIGYFPILKLLRHSKDFNFGTERMKISHILIINSYVKNIMIGMFIPLLSYIAFAYALTLKKFLWILLSFILIGASIVSVTINFEKSPIVFYLFVLVLIAMYVKGGVAKKTMVAFVILMICGMAFIYVKMGYNFKASDSNFYNGLVGRTLFTQVGTLTMHFDLFPTIFAFLGGRSFSPTALSLFGVDGTSLRSGKLVMDFYGSDKVYDGTGGVMNAFFIGESYANFGFIGMVLSIIYVAALIALIFYLFLKLEKNPFNIAMMAFLTNRFALTTQSGFTDFVYNSQFILLIMTLLAGHFIPKIYQKWIYPKFNLKIHPKGINKKPF